MGPPWETMATALVRVVVCHLPDGARDAVEEDFAPLFAGIDALRGIGDGAELLPDFGVGCAGHLTEVVLAHVLYNHRLNPKAPGNRLRRVMRTQEMA